MKLLLIKSKSFRSGLVPQRKQVQRGGKIYTTTDRESPSLRKSVRTILIMKKSLFLKKATDYANRLKRLAERRGDPVYSLEYFRKLILDRLDTLDDVIEKAVYAPGTIRTWKGHKFIKGPDKKWRRYYDKEDRGTRISIKNLIKKVEAIDSVEDLMKLVMLHRDHFEDENGRPIPLVQELHKYIEERQAKINPASAIHEEKRGSDKWEIDRWTPEFPEKLSKIMEYNSVKDIEISEECLSAIKRAGFNDVDDFAQEVNDWVRSNRIISRFYLRDVLKHWAYEPILKNQIETGTSHGGILDEHSRNIWETKTAGMPVNSTTMTPRERPVYGIVGKNDQEPAREYGYSSIIFKDSVRERTTYTIGNSSSEQGAFQGDVKAIFNRGRPIDFGYFPSILLETQNVLRYARTYMEAQIWGSADLTKDAEKIVIGDNDVVHISQNKALWNKFKAKMARAGVAIEDTKGNLL